MRVHYLLPLLGVLLLVGAGCESTPATNTETPGEQPPVEEGDAVLEEASDDSMAEESEATSETDGETKGAAAMVTEVRVDDTWNTYTSRGGDWQFQWPTKGRYAPMWDVSFVGGDDLNDGCYGDGEANSLRAGDNEFCHTSRMTGATAADYYATEIGGDYVLLTFTKGTDENDAFDAEAYRAHLDQIVGTFKLLK